MNASWAINMGKSTHTAYEFSNLVLTIEQTYSESKIIILGCLTSWTLCRLKFGCVWLILLLYICRTYYKLTTRRIKRAIRDETRRYHARKILAAGETVNWLNELLDRIWHLYEQPLCQQIVQHVNAGLSGGISIPGKPSPRRVVLHSLAPIEHPIHFTRVKVVQRPDSDTIILESEFTLRIRQLHTHGFHLFHHASNEPLVNLRVHHTDKKGADHDLEIQIRELVASGILRLEIDCSRSHPAILQPHIELRGQPNMDCSVRPLSHHTFPFEFEFPHHVDWRTVLEMQIREVLRRAFKTPLSLPLSLPFVGLLGERVLVRTMRWLWQVERYWEHFRSY
jgi:Ca2+-dependent lipid-binding protein